MESHLLQMRGLKLHFQDIRFLVRMSHLLQMRGLKREWILLWNSTRKSHLLQMRGLKPPLENQPFPPMKVASFTDAWIETPVVCGHLAVHAVASFTDAWIETGSLGTIKNAYVSRIFYRCVD